MVPGSKGLLATLIEIELDPDADFKLFLSENALTGLHVMYVPSKQGEEKDGN